MNTNKNHVKGVEADKFNPQGMTRRGFLGGLAVLGLAGGCRSFGLGSDILGADEAELRLGVVSDIHATTPGSLAKFRRALVYFRMRGADAVVVTGDLADWGLKSSLLVVKEAWDAEMSGTGIVPLFITGNHDFEGWHYSDMTLDMHVQGYSEKEAMARLGMQECWEEVFGEPYAEIRHRKVKGFDFVSAEWKRGKRGNDEKVIEWFNEHRDELSATRPVFFMRHAPLPGTVAGSDKDGPGLELTEFLKGLPCCVSMTGHKHWTLNDERSIWQGGGLTALSVPSMSYTTLPTGYENGYATRDTTCTHSMPRLPARENLVAAQGYFVTVGAGAMTVERRDFEDDMEAAPPWVVPMPQGATRPYSFAEHAPKVPVPAFPPDATVETRMANSVRRNGTWAMFLALGFPSASAPGWGRVFDYAARVVMEDGSVFAEKRYLSPSYYRTLRHEQNRQEFWFDAMDLPERGRYRIQVVARNCFGAESAPIFSRAYESVPGKTSVA